MHWWVPNTKFFQRFAAIKNTNSHTLREPKHKIFSAICSDQKYLWICIGGTLSQNLFGDFQLKRILMNMHWWNLNTKSFRRFSAIKEYLLTCLDGTLTKNLFRPFSAIKNTYCQALVGPDQEIFSAISSYQEYLLTCIVVTLTQNCFGDLQRSRILMDMHWWVFKPESFRQFSANKNTYEHALVES